MEVSMQYPPGDPRAVDKIVCQLKSQGIFDRFRKECIADVDTKPAYQNLHQRVEGTVAGFLANQEWRQDLNKNQLRDSLRKHIHESGFLDIGVERIVDQVVNPKILSVLLPQIEDVVYNFLGLEKPKRSKISQTVASLQSAKSFKPPKKETLEDLLPKDLDPISPGSVGVNSDEDIDDSDSNKKDDIDEVTEEHVNEEEKVCEEEESSPPFEPIEEVTAHENENSVDSHLSGISGLTSNDSQVSNLSFCADNAQINNSPSKTHTLELSNQDSQLSKVSSGSRLSIAFSDDQEKSIERQNSVANSDMDVQNEDSHISQSPVLTACDGSKTSNLNMSSSMNRETDDIKESVATKDLLCNVGNENNEKYESVTMNVKLKENVPLDGEVGSCGDISKDASMEDGTKILDEAVKEKLQEKKTQEEWRRNSTSNENKESKRNESASHTPDATEVKKNDREKIQKEKSDSKSKTDKSSKHDDRESSKYEEKRRDSKEKIKLEEKLEKYKKDKLEMKYDHKNEEKEGREKLKYSEKEAKNKIKLEETCDGIKSTDPTVENEKVEGHEKEKFRDRIKQESKSEKDMLKERTKDERDCLKDQAKNIEKDTFKTKNDEKEVLREKSRHEDRGNRDVSREKSKYEEKDGSKDKSRHDEKISREGSREKIKSVEKQERDSLKDKQKSEDKSERELKEKVRKDTSKERSRHEKNDKKTDRNRSRHDGKEVKSEKSKVDDRSKKSDKENSKERSRKESSDGCKTEETEEDKKSKSQNDKKEKSSKDKVKYSDKSKSKHEEKHKDGKLDTRERDGTSKYDSKSSEKSNKDSKSKSKTEGKEERSERRDHKKEERSNKEKSKEEKTEKDRLSKSHSKDSDGSKRSDKRREGDDTKSSRNNDHKSKDKKKDSKSKSVTDDHHTHRDKHSDDRRSTDRDSNGTARGQSTNSRITSSDTHSSRRHERRSTNSSGSSKSEGGGNCKASDGVESRTSDYTGSSNVSVEGSLSIKKRVLSKHEDESGQEDDEYSCDNSAGKLILKLKKPKIAANIFEARKIMHLRKSLAKFERRQQQDDSKSHSAEVDIPDDAKILYSGRVIQPNMKPYKLKEYNEASDDEKLYYFTEEEVNCDMYFLDYVKKLEASGHLNEVSDSSYESSDNGSEESEKNYLRPLTRIKEKCEHCHQGEKNGKHKVCHCSNAVKNYETLEEKEEQTKLQINIEKNKSFETDKNHTHREIKKEIDLKIDEEQNTLNKELIDASEVEEGKEEALQEYMKNNISSVLGIDSGLNVTITKDPSPEHDMDGKDMVNFVSDISSPPEDNLHFAKQSVLFTSTNRIQACAENRGLKRKAADYCGNGERKHIVTKDENRSEGVISIKPAYSVSCTPVHITATPRLEQREEYSHHIDSKYNTICEERLKVHQPDEANFLCTPTRLSKPSLGLRKSHSSKTTAPDIIGYEGYISKEIVEFNVLEVDGNDFASIKDNNNIDKSSSDDEKGCSEGLSKELISTALRDLMMESGLNIGQNVGVVSCDTLEGKRIEETRNNTEESSSSGNVSARKSKIGRSRRLGLARPPRSPSVGNDFNPAISRTLPVSNNTDYNLPLSPESDASAPALDTDKKLAVEGKEDKGEHSVNSAPRAGDVCPNLNRNMESKKHYRNDSRSESPSQATSTDSTHKHVLETSTIKRHRSQISSDKQETLMKRLETSSSFNTDNSPLVKRTRR